MFKVGTLGARVSCQGLAFSGPFPLASPTLGIVMTLGGVIARNN